MLVSNSVLSDVRFIFSHIILLLLDLLFIEVEYLKSQSKVYITVDSKLAFLHLKRYLKLKILSFLVTSRPSWPSLQPSSLSLSVSLSAVDCGDPFSAG